MGMKATARAARARLATPGGILLAFSTGVLMLIAVIPGAWVVSVVLAISAGWGFLLCAMLSRSRPEAREDPVPDFMRRIDEKLEEALRDRDGPDAGVRHLHSV